MVIINKSKHKKVQPLNLGSTKISNKSMKKKQAKTIYSFTNTKKKLLKPNAAIWFYEISRNYQLTPKYNIEVNGNNKQSRNTKKIQPLNLGSNKISNKSIKKYRQKLYLVSQTLIR